MFKEKTPQRTADFFIISSLKLGARNVTRLPASDLSDRLQCTLLKAKSPIKQVLQVFFDPFGIMQNHATCACSTFALRSKRL
jgi:hypothetical protein